MVCSSEREEDCAVPSELFNAEADGNSRTIKAQCYKNSAANFSRQDSLGASAVLVREATAKGYAEAQDGDSINIGQPNSTAPRGRVGKGVANTLTCASEMACVQGVRIRRLTPKECFRLQGWADDYFEKAQLVNSDSQLYKQAGNGVTVSVIRAIGEAINATEK